ncbi:MAG: hypothetical protein EBY09_13750 [Verrucomicrobia bacterium]|nr:hypothetical protein [Verrucomicrobiota bacterium]NDD39481.1 hypothetical protein [Verrucomicrobiota bacterium]NDE99457.1 hypothetical protein [Verrucomicrobiota bacterium]
MVIGIRSDFQFRLLSAVHVTPASVERYNTPKAAVSNVLPSAEENTRPQFLVLSRAVQLSPPSVEV